MRRVLSAVLLLLLGLLAAVGSVGAQTAAAPVVTLDASGVVDPFLASYLVDGIREAEEDGAGAILILIDTPGGLASSTRDITMAILGSDIPVITYVAPPGARAASAGTFILMAGSVAAMAPGTNVGAAHPVGVSGVIAEEKATNDAAAGLQAIAQARDRSIEFAAAAVRDSASITAEQALEGGVIDVIAADVPELLDAVEGMSVPVADGQTVTLETASAPVIEENMNAFYSFLHALLTPDLAFLFLWMGLTLLILEIFVPGGILGTLGAIMLVLAIASIGMLPVQLIGVAFVIASVTLFIIEIQQPGIGLPFIGGLICLILGGVTLFDRSIPAAGVSPWVIGLVAVLVSVFFAFVIQAAIKMRRRPVESSLDLVGQEAVVLRDLDPSGTVRIRAEEWSADAPTTIEEGATVRVTAVEGLRLKVERVAESSVAEVRQGGKI